LDVHSWGGEGAKNQKNKGGEHAPGKPNGNWSRSGGTDGLKGRRNGYSRGGGGVKHTFWEAAAFTLREVKAKTN